MEDDYSVKLREDIKKAFQEKAKDILETKYNEKPVSNPEQIIASMQSINERYGNKVTLPQPIRMENEKVKEVKRALLGNIYTIIEAMLDDGDHVEPGIITIAIMDNDFYFHKMKSMGVEFLSLYGVVVHEMYMRWGRSVFTLTRPLHHAIMDMDISPDLPAQFVRAPQKICYVEFIEREFRRESIPKMVFLGKHLMTVEGVYIVENDNADISRISQESIENLHLDPSQPVRVIEFVFTGSPIDTIETAPFTNDAQNMIKLYIQDEMESIKDIAKRQIDVSIRNNEKLSNLYRTGNTHINKERGEELGNLLDFIIKALLYINSDNRVSEIRNDKQKLENKLKVAGAKKQAKIRQQYESAYDKTLIGPKKKYISIHSIMSQSDMEPGSKRPHLRRGYFGVRWAGKNKAVQKLSWIRPTKINVKEGSDIDHLIQEYIAFI